MPDPFCLVLPAKEGKIATKVSAGLDTLAVRIPDNEIFKEILKKGTQPWSLPSANLSGKPSPTRVEHVIEDFAGLIL